MTENDRKDYRCSGCNNEIILFGHPRGTGLNNRQVRQLNTFAKRYEVSLQRYQNRSGADSGLNDRRHYERHRDHDRE